MGGATGAVRGRLRQLVDGAAVLARRNPLEAITLVLMGVGGAIFPPVWLFGVGLALTSKIWDRRDKWVGILVPAMLVVAGAVLALILGGTHGSIGSYAFEAWLSAGRVSRAASVVGAGYLAWRLNRGPREPKQPPWNVPRRRG
ncbi:MAG TPA: hypothetical protein VN840_11815 [Streptosporangiaceae bacterium]|nr:hypothetical protein [Streptosporangiaceae bacterium]